MKNLKTTILTALIALCCYTNLNAQGKTKGKVAMPGRPGTFAVIGGGLLTPSSDAKDNANLVNSATINADVFLPLFRKEGSNFNFGVNLGGSYSFGGSGNPSTPLPAAYAVTGATSSSVAYKRGGDPAQAGFLTGIGPQANFYFGKFIVSPMVLGEYFSITQKELSVVQTTEFNGQSYDFNLATMPETKTSGFAVTPKIRFEYMISERFGFFADASYTMGPKAEIVYSQLIPNGNPSQQSNSYNIQQLETGTMVKGEPKSTALNSVGFNFGVVIGLGGNGHDIANGVVKPACTCCGSRSHDKIDCPDKLRCANQTVSTQVPNKDLMKLDDDIRKGWNGKIVDLFEGNYAEILVEKNGGVEKLIDQINKEGKGKATIEKYGDKQYVKIESKTEVSYYPVDNSPQFTIINNGGFVCNSTCSTCGLVANVGPCICNSPTGPISTGGEHPLPVACGSSISHPITEYIASLDHSALLIPISTDNSGDLSSTSIKDMEQLVVTQMPHATAIKSELKKEDNLSYIETHFTDKGKGFVLISKLGLSGKNLIIKDKNLMMCAGSCNGKTYDCSLNGWGSVGSHVYCNCETGCKFKIINFPNPILLDSGVKAIDLEQLIIIDGE